MLKKKLRFCVIIGLLLLVSACRSESPGTTTPDEGQAPGTESPPKAAEEAPVVVSTDPVHLKIHIRHLNEEEFAQFIADPVKKKYPYISVERVDSAQNSLMNLIAAQDIPDITADYPFTLPNLVDMELNLNIEELAKKHKFDLGRLQPEYLDSLRIVSDLDHLIGLPMFNNSFALFYNQDLFERMAEPLPKDGMTWEDARQIGARLTRNEGGVQYYGLYPGEIFRGAYQLSLPFIDFDKKQGALQTDAWKDLFQTWLDLFNTPGAAEKLPSDPPSVATEKFLTGTLGMIGGHNGTLQSMRQVNDLNWDLVTYPTNPKAPDTGQRVDTLVFSITAQSKYPDQAFQVVSVILSDEVQTNLSRNARVSVLKDTAVHGQFGKEIAEFEGKNVVAMTKLKLAVIQPFKYKFVGADHPSVYVSQAFESVLKGEQDINTALRTADEKLTQTIQELTQ